MQFELPFPCGEPWHGTTRADHNHPNAVDFNSYEGEQWEHGHHEERQCSAGDPAHSQKTTSASSRPSGPSITTIRDMQGMQ